MDSDGERRNTMDGRYYQRQIQRLNDRYTEDVTVVPLSPRSRRPQEDSEISDSDYENDISFSAAGGLNNPKDRSVYSTPLPANDPTDDDDDDTEDEDADVTLRQSPARNRLRTSDVEEPCLGESLSSIAPTPYSLSGRHRDTVLRRSSSTFSEEEFEIKYRRVEESPAPPSPVADNAAQTSSTNASYPTATTYKSRSEDPPRRRLPHDDVKRPRSEMGTRQPIPRAKQASRFTVNEDVAEFERHRYNYRPPLKFQASLEDGHRRPARGVTPPRSSRDESKRSFPTKYRDPRWNTERVSAKRPRDEELYGRSVPSSGSSRSRSPHDYAAGPPLFTTTTGRWNYPERRRDSPIASKAVDDTHVPRVLRTFCNVPDLVFDGEKREPPGVCHKHSTYKVASRATQTPSTEGTPPASRASRGSHGTTGAGPGARDSGLSVATSNGGSPLTGRARNGPRSSPAERSPGSEEATAAGQALRSVDGCTPPLMQQRPLSPNVITCTPEKSSSFTGRTDDAASAPVADSSDVEVMERIPSLPVAELSLEKAVQVTIAQPDKGFIACTVLSGVLAAALVAAVFYALLSR